MFVEHQALRVQIIWSGKLLHLIARSHTALGLLLTGILIFKLFSSDSKKKKFLTASSALCWVGMFVVSEACHLMV